MMHRMLYVLSGCVLVIGAAGVALGQYVNGGLFLLISWMLFATGLTWENRR